MLNRYTVALLSAVLFLLCLSGRAEERPVASLLAWRGEAIVLLGGPADADVTGEDRLVALLEAQLGPLGEGAAALGVEPFFGGDAALVDVEVIDREAVVVARLSGSEWERESDEARMRLGWLLDEWLQKLEGIQAISFQLVNGAGEELVQLANEGMPLASKPKVPEGEEKLDGFMSPANAPAQGTAQPMGALSDASIFLSPGHGWRHHVNDEGVNMGWSTQRANNYEMIEDLNSAESVLQYLHPYLWNAGARIYTTRERDLNPNMAIVTQGGPGYSQTGSWTTQNVGGAYDGTLRYATTVTGAPTATARFTPNIPEAGHYAVYAWYREASGGTTTEDARMMINHTGDSTLWVQNQKRDGFTWKYLGRYYFEEGSNPVTGSVVIDNKSSIGGRRVMVSAVRFGGGMGDVEDPASGTTSGRPRWEESGLYYAAFLGKDSWASSGPVNAMPRWAAWEHEPWEQGKSIYLAWHTNAASGKGTGTETFAYSSNRRKGPFEGVVGGDKLRDLVHDQVLKDIRAVWKSNWTSRGKLTEYFGEINPRNNSEMPAALIEMAFHDREEDVKYLLDPKFRMDTARAVYKGLVQFYVQHLPGFTNGTYLPEPPRDFRVSAEADGTVQLAWNAPVFSTGTTGLYGHAATGYRIYRSKNGYGFSNGTAVGGTSASLSGFAPGEVVYLRVAATNAGGESFPTSTLAVRIPEPKSKTVLLVNGFTRNDRFMNAIEIESQSGRPMQRGYLNKLNTDNYSIPHAKAIAAYPEMVAIASAESSAVESGAVVLDDYDAVIWMAGLQAQVNDIGNEQTPAFTSPIRARLAQFTSGGGQLFISGAEIAWDTNRAGMSAWLRGILKSSLVNRSAGGRAAAGQPASIMPNWSGTFNVSGNGPGYRVDFPDAIQPENGGVAALEYTGTSDQMVDSFDQTGPWQQPGYSGQTNADPASSFSIVGTPVREGSGAAKLSYVWGSGNFIREYNPAQPKFPMHSELSFWVYGDGSGHRIRLAVRDSDGDIFVNDYTTINFTGWQNIVWEDIPNNATFWAGGGDQEVNGPLLGVDSIQISRTGAGPAAGNLYFDEMLALSASGDEDAPTAAVQFDGNYRLFYLAFPFESLTSDGEQEVMMARVLDFFRIGLTPFEEWLEEHFTEAQLADPAIGGELADPAGDGIPNLLKYAMDLDPWSSEVTDLPKISVRDGQLELTYRESKVAPDVVFVVEMSENLTDWYDASAETQVVGTVNEGSAWRIRIRDLSPFPENGRRFIRLRVVRE